MSGFWVKEMRVETSGASDASDASDGLERG